MVLYSADLLIQPVGPNNSVCAELDFPLTHIQEKEEQQYKVSYEN